MGNNRNSRGFQEESAFDDENRINWERKQKRKRPGEPEGVDEEPKLDEVVDTRVRKKKEKSRKKRRQLVYDEGIGQVVVKRKRKRQNDLVFDDEWEDFN